MTGETASETSRIRHLRRVRSGAGGLLRFSWVLMRFATHRQSGNAGVRHPAKILLARSSGEWCDSRQQATAHHCAAAPFTTMPSVSPVPAGDETSTLNTTFPFSSFDTVPDLPALSSAITAG